MQEIKISVITPCVRHAGLELVAKALKRQSFPRENFEWIIGSPTKPAELPIPFIWVQDPPKEDGDVWTLNKCYNAMIKQAKSDLIVSWQDWTYADPDCLEKFLFHYQQEPKTFVGAVGNKYSDTTFTVVVWKDPRERNDQGSYYPVYFTDIEWNLCAVPKEAVLAVGGFIEEMDKYYGLDGYSVNERANELGYDFKLDQTIKSYSLEHGRLNGTKWDEMNWLQGDLYEKLKIKLRADGKWPSWT